MLTVWAKDQPDQATKTSFERQVVGAKPVLDRMKTILKEEFNSLDRSEIDIKVFEDPNWAYKQAYKNGYRAALGVITKLVDLDKQDPPKE